MDTDAEAQPLPLGALCVLLSDRRLDREGAFDRIDGAGEIGKDAVPGGREDAAAVSGDQPVDNGARGAQGPQRAELVQLYQVAVADDVRRENRGELPFDDLDFWHPGASSRHRCRPVRLL